MKIGIIGAGKVGTTLGKYLQIHGIPVAGYVSRSYDSAMEAAEFTETKAYHTLEELMLVSDTLFITTPDGAIGQVWDCIKKAELADKIVCHFSGSLSSHVFSEMEQTGGAGCSIHPMYAFGDKFTSYQQFHTAILTIEGQQPAVERLTELFGGKLGHKILQIDAKDKMKYHAAASMVSNHMIGLFQAGLDLLEECGFSQEDSRELLKPLVRVNVENMLEGGTQAALTGPIERNDVETVKKHLQAIDSTGVEQIYRELGKVLVGVAEKKNPERDYAELMHLLAQNHVVSRE